ncbi:hypothetical protein HPB47_000677 [Ixodes persulcatus]|uniref:Uncharacterized protein n=1 Tax=Ixodes persulcatus TaxID=34615 RepID=A0AC60PRE1_IXOPE|nr:hypothetical protein HPB47_000677 [Ixodes persulcatus]
MVLARITWILETHRKLHPMQTGFRPNLSTQDSLALMHKDLTKNPANAKPRTMVAIDIKKAFDTIPHDTVIRAAERRGLHGRILNFIKAFLKDRQAVYGINYLRLTATQKEKLEVLNRSAMREITGLPNISPIKELHKAAQVNTIEEIAQEMKISQYNRLQKTWHGRIILEKLGRRTWCIPSNQPSQPPWEDEPVVSLKPIPMNQGEGHRKRRAAAAKKHLEDLGRLREQEDVEILYTDAARDNDGRTAVAWLAESSSKKESKLAPMTHSTKTAELLAIQLAIEAHVESTNKHLYVFTDSKEAVKECLHIGSKNNITRKIKNSAKTLRLKRRRLELSWIPGHMEIPGNEEANEAARARLQDDVPSQGLASSSVKEKPVTPDPEEQKEMERIARKQRLASLLPMDDCPIPPGVTRWERVCTRRLQTCTALTPTRSVKLAAYLLPASTLYGTVWASASKEKLPYTNCPRKPDPQTTENEQDRPKTGCGKSGDVRSSANGSATDVTPLSPRFPLRPSLQTRRASRKREARRRQHSTPAEQLPGATARFRREFVVVENPFDVTCAVCDRLWFAGGVSDENNRETGACALRQCIESADVS